MDEDEFSQLFAQLAADESELLSGLLADEPDMRLLLQPQEIPGDVRLSLQWGLLNVFLDVNVNKIQIVKLPPFRRW